MPYLKGKMPSQLETYVPQVITAFISSRVELVRAIASGEAAAHIDDPLENEDLLTEQLDMLPNLCRFQLEQAC